MGAAGRGAVAAFFGPPYTDPRAPSCRCVPKCFGPLASPAQDVRPLALGIAGQIAAAMGRHACGYKLANDGQDTRAVQHYLGHRNIQHTVRYTEMAPDRFKDFWRG